MRPEELSNPKNACPNCGGKIESSDGASGAAACRACSEKKTVVQSAARVTDGAIDTAATVVNPRDVRSAKTVAAPPRSEPITDAPTVRRAPGNAAEGDAPNDGSCISLSSFAMPEKEDVAGKRFGAYVLISELGRGGMGAVYLAEDPRIGRKIALKVMLSGEQASANEVARFRREASVLSRMQHPNIIAMHDFGVHEGKLFYTMDYIEGIPVSDLTKRIDTAPEQKSSSLKDLVQYLRSEKSTQLIRIDNDGSIKLETRPLAALLPIKQTLHLFVKILNALEYAHERGVVHRDLKPANVLINMYGEPVLMDFGLATAASDMSSENEMTVSGQLMGTPIYMAPEQASKGAKACDARSDVYSTAAILYEMTTGQNVVGRKFDNVMGIVNAVANNDVVPPRKHNPDLPADVQTILLKALEKDPDRRYRNAGEFRADIERFLGGDPIAARPPSLAYLAGKRFRKHRFAYIAAIVCVLASGGAWFVTSGKTRQAEQQVNLAERERQKSERQVEKITAEKLAAEQARSAALRQAEAEAAEKEKLARELDTVEARELQDIQKGLAGRGRETITGERQPDEPDQLKRDEPAKTDDDERTAPKGSGMLHRQQPKLRGEHGLENQDRGDGVDDRDEKNIRDKTRPKKKDEPERGIRRNRPPDR